MAVPRSTSLRRWLRVTVVVLLALAPLTVTGRSWADPLAVTRVEGEHRAATAVAVSAAAWPAGADTVFLARSDAYPDALSAAPLATALDAPLLLTRPDRLEAVVADEIARLDVREVVLLGGPNAVSAEVASQVRALGATVRRVAGADRFATSAAIADELRKRSGPARSGAYVARATQGKGWADALSAAPLAGRQGRPLLLADHTRLPYTAGWLSAYDALTLVGGSAVLDDALLRSAGRPASRVAGADRYATSLALADAALDDLRASGRLGGGLQVWLATGTNFPDALAAGPAVGRRDAVLLLVPPAWFTSATRQWIAEHAGDIADIRLLGGQAALPDRVAEDLARMDPDAPETLLPPPDEKVLMYSARADLSRARPLQGAVVSGDIHVFLARCDADGRCTAE